jgi:hypothetical protein
MGIQKVNSTRRQFVGGAAALGAASARPLHVAARERPHVLFIVSDQCSPLAAGLAGANKMLRTPAADSIAASGIRFDNAYCTFPLCSPSRASLLMGRMPHECGVMFNFQGSDRSGAIPENTPRYGDLFTEAGYDTGYFGEEHRDGAGYPCRRAIELLQEAVELVSSRKILWGTDIPLTLRRYTYRQMIDVVRTEASFLSDRDRRQILGENAAHVFFPARQYVPS